MKSIGTVMFAEGQNTQLTASGIEVTENMLLDAFNAQTSRNFNVAITTGGAAGIVEKVQVTKNSGVDVSQPVRHVCAIF